MEKTEPLVRFFNAIMALFPQDDGKKSGKTMAKTADIGGYGHDMRRS